MKWFKRKKELKEAEQDLAEAMAEMAEDAAPAPSEETVPEPAEDAAPAEVKEAQDAAPEEKELVIERTEDKLLIAPVGRLDTVVSAALKDKLNEYEIDGADIELDFENVAYISSAGLRLLVSLSKQAKAGGHTMVIKNTNAVVNEVFRVSGFNKTLTVL